AAIVLASAIWFAGSGAAYAQTPDDGSAIAPEVTAGAPMIPQDGPTGYYIWHDDSGIHVRTHGPHEQHDFVMRLRTDGTFTDVSTVRLESRDQVQVLDGGHVLEYHVHTYDGVDGVDFHIVDGSKLHFHLELDQHLISTDRIYLGSMQIHPATNPFTIRW